MALKDAISTVLNRNNFYRDGYRLMLRISLVQGVVILLLIGGMVSLLLTQQTRLVYFATTSDGRIINIVPLNEAYRTQGEVVAWAATVAQNTLSFDYKDYRDRLQQSAANFTRKGWETFNKGLKDSSILDTIEARRLIVSTVVNAAPQVIREGVVNGVYTWDLRFPITITYAGNEAPQQTRTDLFLRVVRISNLEQPDNVVCTKNDKGESNCFNYDGIAIEQWVTQSPQQPQ